MSVLRDSGERENRNRGPSGAGSSSPARKRSDEGGGVVVMADDGELTVELAVEPEVGMELCLEKLKMLRYERDFLTSRRPPWPPCTRTHFAILTPGQNTNELFHHFTSLCAHLLTLCGRRFRAPTSSTIPTPRARRSSPSSRRAASPRPRSRRGSFGTATAASASGSWTASAI